MLKQPLISYKFRVMFYDEDDNTLISLTKQISYCRLNLNKNIIKLGIRNPIDVKIEFFNEISKNNFHKIVLDILDNTNCDTIDQHIMHNLKCIDHKVEFDYASNKPVIHNFKFKYD